jgi:hypothetical protein
MPLSSHPGPAFRRLACASLLALGALVSRPARAQAPRPDGAEATPRPPPRTRGGPVGPVLGVNPQYQWLYGIPIRAVEFDAGFGLRSAAHEKVLAYLVGGALFGQTEGGLGVKRGTLSAKVERQFDQFHVGFMAGFGVFWLSRAERGTISNLTLSGKLYAGPEFKLAGDKTTLTIDATFGADLLPGDKESNDALLFGPGVAVGVRFF